MKKIQLHQFDPEIYPFKLWIAVTEDINKVERRVAKEDKLLEKKSAKLPKKGKSYE